MPHLDIINLSADYAHLKVLSGVSLAVEKGEVVCLVGPSGSGKSTLLRVLMGLTLPTAGAVKVDGREIDYHSKASVRARPRVRAEAVRASCMLDRASLRVCLSASSIVLWFRSEIFRMTRFSS